MPVKLHMHMTLVSRLTKTQTQRQLIVVVGLWMAFLAFCSDFCQIFVMCVSCTLERKTKRKRRDEFYFEKWGKGQKRKAVWCRRQTYTKISQSAATRSDLCKEEFIFTTTHPH